MGENKKFNIAVVGCGRISKNHFGAIAEHSDYLNLTSVCDIVPERADSAAKEHGATSYTNFEELLKNEKNLDLVALCTPSGIHPEQAILASEHGVNVVSEKPMGVRWTDGLRMVRECKKNEVRLFVVKQNRFNATLQLLKNTIEQGRFGKIYMVSVNVFWTRPQDYYDMAPWRGTYAQDGGALMNQASHYVDLLDWLIGPVKRMNAFCSTLARDIEAEDTAVMSIEWAHGALGSMSVTMLTYPKNYEGSITILGEKGTARVGGVAVNEIIDWNFDKKIPEDDEIKKASYETTSVYGFGHPIYYKNVVDVMRGEAEPFVDGDSGLRSLELLCAAYESSESKKIVDLPLPREL